MAQHIRGDYYDNGTRKESANSTVDNRCGYVRGPVARCAGSCMRPDGYCAG